MSTLVRRLLTFCLLALAGCRVDVVVDLTLADDGTGELVVTATADADVVEQVPGLAEDLRFDDAVASGWTIEGPTPIDAGGLTVTLRHSVSSAEEATNLLASLGPPFVGVTLTRTSEDDVTITELTGQLVLENGFDSFADSDLIALAGGTPFAADLAATTPQDSMSVQLRTTLPGDLEETTGAEVDGVIEWSAPLEGTALDLTTRTEQRPGPTWASILSVTALVLLGVWVLLAGAFLVSVARVRRRRARRRGLSEESERRLEELGERS